MRVIISSLLYVIRMGNFVLISSFYYLEQTAATLSYKTERSLNTESHRNSLSVQTPLSAKRLQIDLITVFAILKARSTVTGRKPSRSKEKIQQQTQPAYDAMSGNRTRATVIIVIYIPVIVVYICVIDQA